MKDRSRIQHQILNVECRCHHLDQDSDRIQDHNIIHEIRDRVPSEFPFQFVHQIHSVFPFFCENANIPFALPFSYVPYYNSQRFLLSNHLYTASPRQQRPSIKSLRNLYRNLTILGPHIPIPSIVFPYLLCYTMRGILSKACLCPHSGWLPAFRGRLVFC